MREMSLVKDLKEVKMKSMRDGWGEGLVDVGEKDKQVVVLTGDLGGSTRVGDFKEKWPERFIQVGVAEQNMAGVAAGLALAGKTVFIASYAAFSPAINWNTIRTSICYSRANVKIVGNQAGLMTCAGGATHQGIEDIALMRVLPGMVVLTPIDFYQAKDLTRLMVEHQGPAYLRLTRPETPILREYKGFKEYNKGCKIGGSHVLQEGKDLTIIGCGPILMEALKAVERISSSSSTDKSSASRTGSASRIEIINAYCIKPLDKETILKSVAKTGKVLTIEDHSVIGGLGSAVAELLSQEYPLPVKILGVPDVFGESAKKPEELLAKHGLDAEGIGKAIREML